MNLKEIKKLVNQTGNDDSWFDLLPSYQYEIVKWLIKEIEKYELPFEQMDKDARELFKVCREHEVNSLAADVACHCLALLQYLGKGGNITKE